MAVTSAIKGEGKTTTVINLGYTLARDFGKRVLLLDCDFVCPELKHFSETPIKYGLADCCRGDIPVEEAMTSFTDIPCWIMPAGRIGPGSTELLKTGPLERVLAQLREKFDYILLNAPPILPVATMNVLERHTDLLLLVVRANLTSQQVVKRAVRLAASIESHSRDPQLRSNALASVLHDGIFQVRGSNACLVCILSILSSSVILPFYEIHPSLAPSCNTPPCEAAIPSRFVPSIASRLLPCSNSKHDVRCY